jgi:hypothetical protein
MRDPSKDPKWRIYERAAAELEASYPDCHVIHDHKVIGRRSGKERQVDVWINGLVGPHDINIAVECRCYQVRVGINLLAGNAGHPSHLSFALNDGVFDVGVGQAPGKHFPAMEGSDIGGDPFMGSTVHHRGQAPAPMRPAGA